MKILYVNHTSEVSGGERSLLDLLRALPATARPHVAAPPGRLLTAVARLGIDTTPIVGTAGSLRLHPVHTSRAAAEIGLAAIQVRRAAQRHDVDVIHANSIRAGIVVALARAARPATIVHIRDCLPPGAITSATMRMIASTATTVVANSRYTAQAMAAAAPGARPEVVYNPVDLERFNPTRIDRAWARRRLSMASESRLLIGVVGQLSPWKGHDTAIEALKRLSDWGIDAHLLLVGSAKFVARATRFDNDAYDRQLHELVARAGLERRVSWLGEREDVPELVRALDVLLLPSWEEPFGRSLIEAMAMGVPVVATNVGGPAEIIREGSEGCLVAPDDPDAWARTIRRLAENPRLRQEIGSAGRRRVEQAYTPDRHATAMLDVYERACALSRTRSGGFR
jgi:glycosyltransferase involved in cell wall biosynthesis